MALTVSDLSTNTRSSLSRAHLALGHMTQTKLPASRSSSWWSAWASWFTVCKPQKYVSSVYTYTQTLQKATFHLHRLDLEFENMGFYFTPGRVMENLHLHHPHVVSRAGRAVMIHWLDWEKKLNCFILLS